MTAKQNDGPVKSYIDPRIDIYAPTDAFPYYRVRGFDEQGRRVVDTSGGRTLRAAKAKAADVATGLRRSARGRSRDPRRILVHAEVEKWLDPRNHRTREGQPWSARHTENVRREWRLRIEPHIPKRATVQELDDKHLWTRILNDAQQTGLSPAAVQKTGQVCRSLVSWFMDQGLLERNPMQGVSYAISSSQNRGLDPRVVRTDELPNMDMVYELAWWMAWLAWPQRPGRGGNRRPDVVGPNGRALQPVLAATTGLRNGELFALRPGHLDLTNCEVRVQEQLVEEDSGRRYFTTPKHGSFRSVPFAGFLQHDLKNLIEHRRLQSGEADPLLFCAPQGGLESRRNHTRRFRAAARATGWPSHMTWYSLRHLYGLTQLEALPLEVVSKLMGHHSAQFTATRYLSAPRTGWIELARASARAADPCA